MDSLNVLGCRVCGAIKTVKSHVIPRALMADLRGDDSYIHEIAQDRKGTRFLQSGPIDDSILCASHEHATQAADRYGIEFCRRVIAEVPQDGVRAQVPNPDPGLLVRFACLNIWRHCISKYGPGIGALGPFGRQLEAAIFCNAGELPLLLLARNHLRINHETESTIAIAPFPVRLGEIRFWLFSFSGVQFYLKLDKRRSPGNSEELAANDADPATILQLDPMLVKNVPLLETLMANMVARRN